MSATGVEIRPEVAIYAAFARLNYRPWFALAEFVDNAVQSYLSHKDALTLKANSKYVLRIKIDIGPDSIAITDNAAGIALEDFPRAFLPASPPADTSGLSEFGLGMKAAACWFARRWSVTTVALGDSISRNIVFDIPSIVTGKIERLPIEEDRAFLAHGTIVRLADLIARPQAKTIAKIKTHLASIYRLFLKTGELHIEVNGDPISWEMPQLLEAPDFDNKQGELKRWYREFLLELDTDHRIWGWAGLLARASVTNAGFAVFRRNRLIEGSQGEAFRPTVIFRHSNSYTYQRLVGELCVDGFGVSHTKDGIQWSEWEDDILQWLKDELDKYPLALLRQAEGYRARPSKEGLTADTQETVISSVERIVVQRLPPLVTTQLERAPDDARLPESLPTIQPSTARDATMMLAHNGKTWRVRVELIVDDTCPDWLEIAAEDSKADPRFIHIRVNAGHPFMIRHATPDHSELNALVRLAAGLALAEVTARETGVRQAGTIRRNLNELLSGALSAPSNF